ncbi:uncharacterized protein LOC141679628 [Apium graveolens]|uniref:uncharacterized protein LOC141679628 n=1 Tax=Apium graveolens TaxID=4045 RepID=UPI003D7AB60C
MRVHDQDVTFNVFNAMKFPNDEYECFKVELVDSVVTSKLDQMLRNDVLERALTGESDNEDEEGVEQLQYLNASPWKRRLDLPFESLGLSELKNSQKRLKPSIEEAPTLEFKPLPDQLSSWVSPMQCVPKKEGIIVVANEKNKLIPTQIVTGCYNQICIIPEDQEKTTFTCPFGTFAFRRVSFGLCEKDVPFKFDEEYLAIFESLKKSLTTAHVITAPDWDGPFKMMCDASNFTVGAVLGQRKKNIFHMVYYASKTLNSAQLNYSTIKKELLATVYGLKKFRSYLLGIKVTVFTDHTAIRYLVSKKDLKP